MWGLKWLMETKASDALALSFVTFGQWVKVSVHVGGMYTFVHTYI